MRKYIDLSGKRFGKLLVISRQKIDGKYKWLCKCDCGNVSFVPSTNLFNNHTKSCGCGEVPAPRNITGMRFGRLIAIKWVGKNKHNQSIWECKCDCGNIIDINSNSLISGNTKSCGCLKKEVARKLLIDQTVTHGKSSHPLYERWCAMKRRCNNKNDLSHGGRGIKVCNEWVNDFEEFYNWAINNGFDENLTLDRIDNDGNYEPNNCRWTTYETQANNCRSNKRIEYLGETHTLAEWSKLYNIDQNKVQRRLSVGWDISDALINTDFRKISRKPKVINRINTT